jgi:hypothetical protein
MVAKLVAYDAAATGGWSKSIALVADARDSGDPDFAANSNALRPFIPSDYTVTPINRGDLGTATAHTALMAQVNQGQAIVHYSGHGSVQIWHDDLLTTDDAPLFTNGARLPLFVMMNCLNGFFQGLYPEESLAEALMRAAGGGAVGVWASSGLTDSASQQSLDEAFFRLAFSGKYGTVGEVIDAAKALTADRDVRRTWIFFGDPAMRLKGLPAVVATDSGPTANPFTSNFPTPSNGSASDSTTPAVSPLALYNASIALPPTRLLDWDGDGRADVFLYSSTLWRMVLSQAGVASGTWDRAWELYPADLNGDGYPDLILFDRESGAFVEAINQGNGRFSTRAGHWGSEWTIAVGDFNGDRIEDVLLSNPQTGQWFVGLSDGAGAFYYLPGTAAPNSIVTIGDYNGDGRSDVFLYNPDTGAWTLGLSDGQGQFAWTTGTWARGWAVRAMNVNGDRAADLLLYNAVTGAYAECVSQGTQFACSGDTWKPGLQIVLLPGQRRDDEVLYEPATGLWTLIAHRPSGIAVTGGDWGAYQTLATGDLDGDGVIDVLLYNTSTGVWSALTQSGTTTGNWSPGWAVTVRP